MRKELTSHKVNECNRQIEVFASVPGAGGAATRYDVYGPRIDRGPNLGLVPTFGYNLKFQNGPIAEGVNGLTHEVLLAIIEDRIAGFQTGPFACPENERALSLVRELQAVLADRTKRRDEQGTEGTHKGN